MVSRLLASDLPLTSRTAHWVLKVNPVNPVLTWLLPQKFPNTLPEQPIANSNFYWAESRILQLWEISRRSTEILRAQHLLPHTILAPQWWLESFRRNDQIEFLECETSSNALGKDNTKINLKRLNTNSGY